MVKIKIYDLSSNDDTKLMNELKVWETKTVYAGYTRYLSWGNTYSTRPRTAQPEEPDVPAVDSARANLAQWMDSLEVRIQELRKQIGIN